MCSLRGEVLRCECRGNVDAQALSMTRSQADRLSIGRMRGGTEGSSPTQSGDDHVDPPSLSRFFLHFVLVSRPTAFHRIKPSPFMSACTFSDSEFVPITRYLDLAHDYTHLGASPCWEIRKRIRPCRLRFLVFTKLLGHRRDGPLRVSLRKTFVSAFYFSDFTTPEGTVREAYAKAQALGKVFEIASTPGIDLA